MALDLKSPSASTHRLTFHGAGGSLLGIHLVNMFLTVATLGIYYFWARVKLRSYLYGQTEFAGERFAFHGTGMELLKGWLKAAVIIGALLVVNTLLFFALEDTGLAWLSQLVPLAGAMMLAPFAIVGSRRYRLSRTSWQGIRFSFRGRVKDFVAVYLPGALLTMLTLGLYFPFFMVRLQEFLIRQSAYGSKRFEFDGEGFELFKTTLLAWILIPLTLGLYGFWYQAQLERFLWSHTSFAGARFQSTVTGGGLLGLTLTNGLLLLFTFGLAFPWVMVRQVRYKLSHLTLEGQVDWASIRQDAKAVSATAEGLADFLDLELGV